MTTVMMITTATMTPITIPAIAPPLSPPAVMSKYQSIKNYMLNKSYLKVNSIFNPETKETIILFIRKKII